MNTVVTVNCEKCFVQLVVYFYYCFMFNLLILTVKFYYYLYFFVLEIYDMDSLIKDATKCSKIIVYWVFFNYHIASSFINVSCPVDT